MVLHHSLYQVLLPSLYPWAFVTWTPPASTALAAYCHCKLIVGVEIWTFGVTTFSDIVSFCCCSFLLSHCWPVTALFCPSQPRLPPLLAACPCCCHLPIWLLLFFFFCLLYLSLIAHCKTTAILTTGCHCAMMLMLSPCHLLWLVATRWGDCWLLLLLSLSRLVAPVPSEPLLLLQSMLLPVHQCHLLLLVAITTSWLLLVAVAVTDTTCCTGAKATDVYINIVAAVDCY